THRKKAISIEKFKTSLTSIQYDFHSKEYNVIENIRQSIIELKELGFYEPLIKEMLLSLVDIPAEENKKVLSRLYLDSRYNIYLPEQ
ncbi:MAG: hypothetical protein LBU22_00845, partial [Dysgonamonadaceae bacterium]|nr:hypothetical protein [Dysgonamonadaceae bacterium]